MPNRWERNHGLNPRVADARRDPDHDGLRNIAEYRRHVVPRAEDSDNDGMDDGDEVHDGRASTDVGDADTNDNGVVDGDQDADRDGVDNEDEDDAIEPCLADDDDTDGDSIDNEDENDFGTRVNDADSDDDGVQDGDEHAGVISAVDGARVTIQLAAGGSLTAAVEDETLIACDDGSAGDESDDPSSHDEGDDSADDEGDDVDVEVEVLDPDDFDDDGAAADDDSGDDDVIVDDCAPALQVGMVVYEADVEVGPSGLLLTYLDLVG
jgi:hypothetical protein